MKIVAYLLAVSKSGHTAQYEFVVGNTACVTADVHSVGMMGVNCFVPSTARLLTQALITARESNKRWPQSHEVVF